MQKEKKSECPVDVWMSAKICLPDGKRGFAVAKVVEEADRSHSLLLTLDQSFLTGESDSAQDTTAFSAFLSTSLDNLANLPKGTAILLAPPKIFGVKFWIARIGNLNSVTGNDEPEKNSVNYHLHELKRLKNFLEARSAQRVLFRTPVLLVDTKSYTVTQYFTRDISASGLSISLDPNSKEENDFEVKQNYLLQLKLHEGMTMPALNYECVHKREDILTGAKIFGFALNDRKAKDPDVEYNLTFLTWSDPPDELGDE